MRAPSRNRACAYRIFSGRKYEGETGGYTLAVSMELYMYEDTSQYMQELLEQDTDEEGQENTENTEEDQNPANQ